MVKEQEGEISSEERRRKSDRAGLIRYLITLSVLGTVAVFLGYMLLDEYRDTKSVDGDFCLKHQKEQKRINDSLIDRNQFLKKQNFILKAKLICDSINLSNCK